MKNNVFPSSLLNYKTAGITLEMLPKEQVDGKEALVMRAKPKAGSTVKMYFDATTFLLVRTVATVNSPQMGGDIEQTSTLSDYRAVDGIKVPFQVVNSNALQQSTIKLTRIEHNVPLDDAIFSVKSATGR
jgi:outer membrane lipoprotein-sorting protein